MAAVTGIADDEGAVLWGKKAIQVAEQVCCLDAIGDTLSLLGTAELRQGDLADFDKVGRGREIAERAGDERGMAQADARAAAALAGRRAMRPAGLVRRCEIAQAGRMLAGCTRHGPARASDLRNAVLVI